MPEFRANLKQKNKIKKIEKKTFIDKLISMHLPDLTYLQWLLVIAAYGIGSIPFGYLLLKATGKGDIRKLGSGSIGATNVLRNANKSLGLLTLILDALKGYLAVYIGKKFQVESLCAFAVIIGHLFPVWLKFKGGKGVATYLGVLLALAFPLGLQAFLAWVGFAFLFHYSSLASILTCLLIPLTVWIWDYEDMLYICSILSALIIAMHWSNIIRLFQGKEPVIGKK